MFEIKRQIIAFQSWFISIHYYFVNVKGLRTLELCVDNMQPDFLHDHLYQVRGDMLLALYNSLHSPSEYVQKMSFKVGSSFIFDA